MDGRAILTLIRPANIVTSIADVIAGFAIAGLFSPLVFQSDMLLLVLSTIGLYGGGIVFNDVFDFEQDKINRPERILPSQRLSLKQATGIGLILFGIALVAAFASSMISGLVASLVMVLALVYDKWSKHNKVIGPINMGMCRGANLMLGVSILPSALEEVYLISLIPILFVAAITLTAQKESSGQNKTSIGIAMLLDLSVVAAFFLMQDRLNLSMQSAGVFLLLWYGTNLFFKYRAFSDNTPTNIKMAVKVAVLSIIPLDAAFTAGFGSIPMALLVLALLPISIFLAKKFAVT